uniref:Uncharacterized protein n=1 Tax=Anguilla anguilla TaxID=7936 RepID=A0A0E9R230_ANGAN
MLTLHSQTDMFCFMGTIRTSQNQTLLKWSYYIMSLVL